MPKVVAILLAWSKVRAIRSIHQESRFAQRMLPQGHKDVSNEDALVTQKILSHLNAKNAEVVELLAPLSRVPPQISLL